MYKVSIGKIELEYNLYEGIKPAAYWSYANFLFFYLFRPQNDIINNSASSRQKRQTYWNMYLHKYHI